MEVTFDEVMAIQNKTDPRHTGYWDGSNTDLVAAVDRAWRRQYPGETDISGGTQFDDQLNADVQGRSSQPQQGQQDQVWKSPQSAADRSDGSGQQQQPAAAFGPEWDFTEAQAVEKLQSDLGYLEGERLMSEVKDPDNFKAVFDGFIQTEA